MRSAVFALVGAFGLAAVAVSANAAPAVPSLDAQQQGSIMVQVAGGCGPGSHRNTWGRCASHGHGNYGHRYWRGGGGSAEDLNRQELGRINGGRY